MSNIIARNCFAKGGKNRQITHKRYDLYVACPFFITFVGGGIKTATCILKLCV